MDEAARLERVSRKLTAVPDVQLGPPLTDDQVCAYETRNKLKLPAATDAGIADPTGGTHSGRQRTHQPPSPGWDSAARRCTIDPDQRTRYHAINGLRWAGLLT